jgi:deoxyribose-phosphate aldolase
MGVKASGGVRSYKSALELLGAGATRLGCTASVAVVTGAEGTGST